MRRFLSLMMCGLLAVACVGQADAADDEGVLTGTMESLKGDEVDLSKYEGKVVLIVNVASQCGLTPQYAQLQTLHEEYAEQGLAVLGFPCNQFGRQEPGSAAEISTFCTDNYGVTFDMFAKIEVNGDGACALYKTLTGTETEPQESGDISWNFEKFLLDREGKVIARFGPRTRPDADDVVNMIEKALEDD